MRGTRWIWTLGLALGFFLAAGCRDDTKEVVVTKSTTPTISPALKGKNLSEFHLEASTHENEACITCHGDRSDGIALDAGGTNRDFHATKHALAQFKEQCNACHKRVDLRHISQYGGTLRKQADVSLCYSCHKTGGTASPLYN